MTMTQEQIKPYQLKGNSIITEVPVIGNLIYDEVGKEILTLHNERFKGVKTIEDTHSYKDGEQISYSNTPRVLSYNQILKDRFPELSIHVLTPEEVFMYWDLIPQRSQTYADTDSVAVYPKEGSNENLRIQVLDILGKKKTAVPMIISGLGVIKTDNAYGFEFTQTPFTKAKEAPYLKQEGNLTYEPESGLVSSKQGVRVWVANSGLRGVYRNRSD